MCVSGFFAVHGSFCATQEAPKKCDKAQIYGTEVKEEESLR